MGFSQWFDSNYRVTFFRIRSRQLVSLSNSALFRFSFNLNELAMQGESFYRSQSDIAHLKTRDHSVQVQAGAKKQSFFQEQELGINFTFKKS